ncbi:MAG: outer membrane protein assembly factor BamD [Acidobacteria bacterium]|nr:outer membrane protein assembly factor BamD [Acidobacteriota bacterium]MCY4638663.1 outer membrane protein assembly factor BamD [Acidobacteriota bacterium]
MARYVSSRHPLSRFGRRVGCGLPAACLLLAGAVALSACGSRQADLPPLTEADADGILFERGSQALEEGSWSTAREYFVQIRDNYPQSPLRARSRLGIVESYEGEGTDLAYVSALSELREFLRLYPPTHELAPEAQFKVGMVYFNQMRRPERDQSETRSAVTEFETFIELYAEFADPQLLAEARERLREARDRLSDSNYLVGRFYYRLRYYPGAIDRFREILDEDPGYTRRDAVYFHLADALAIVGRGPEALPLFERLVTEFPATEFLVDANLRIEELKVSMDLDGP